MKLSEDSGRHVGPVFEIVTYGLAPELVNEVINSVRLFSPEDIKLRHVSEVPKEYLNVIRNQYNGFLVSRWIATLRRKEDSVALGVLDVDAYVEPLNFIFGLALPTLNTATVYVTRLKTLASKDKLLARIKKEVIHELGHVFGLEHCRDRRCVMCFSNTLAEVDVKDYRMCRAHYVKLKEKIPGVSSELLLSQALNP